MSEQHFNTANPCLACGACCTTFRVSFYWAEADERGLPIGLTEQVNAWYGCMAGTNQKTPRCRALHGRVGEHVACGVYEQRPSPCREVQAGDEQCRKARQKHGLAPLAALQTVEGNRTAAARLA
jgi:Fe-S-cluster containining protein